MSYRNPKLNIDAKYAAMTQGLNKYYTNIKNTLTQASKNMQRYKEAQDKANKEFQKRLDKNMTPFDKYRLEKMDEVNKALGDDFVSNGLNQDMINELEYIRKALASQLKDQDLTAAGIDALILGAKNNVNQLTQAMINLGAADTQVTSGLAVKPNEEGFILSGGPYQDLLELTIDTKEGIGRTNLRNKNRTNNPADYDLGLGGEYQGVNFKVENGKVDYDDVNVAVNLSNKKLSEAVNTGTQLFNTVKEIEPGLQESFNKSIANIIEQNPSFVNANGKIDQLKIKKYLNTPKGKEHIESITKTNGVDVIKNYWRTIAPDSVTDFENWDSYANEDIFTNYLIEQAAGSEPVKGKVLEFSERHPSETSVYGKDDKGNITEVEYKELGDVKDTIETATAPTNLEQGNIPSIVKPKNDPLGIFDTTPEETVVEEVVETQTPSTNTDKGTLDDGEEPYEYGIQNVTYQDQIDAREAGVDLIELDKLTGKELDDAETINYERVAEWRSKNPTDEMIEKRIKEED
tara:strand:+ start:1563 stop:3116 length:1554 start_codon:yes stop_codon:yes gene_type:complete